MSYLAGNRLLCSSMLMVSRCSIAGLAARLSSRQCGISFRNGCALSETDSCCFKSSLYLSERGYTSKRRKSWSNDSEDAAILEANAYNDLNDHQVLALYDERNKYLVSLPLSKANGFMHRNHRNKTFQVTTEDNENGERIANIISKGKRNSSFTISTKIDQGDLQNKITSIKRKVEDGHVTVITFRVHKAHKDSEADAVAAKLKIVKSLLVKEGLKVTDSLSGLTVRPTGDS